MKPSVILISALTLMTVTCAGCSSTSGKSAASPTPSKVSEVVTTSGLIYARNLGGSWVTPVLDVVRPANAKGAPLVVFLHGGGADKTMYVDETSALARHGAVVFSPNWGNGGVPAGSASDAVTQLKLSNSEVSCAVAFAMAHADEYGADPSRLVLVGNSAGANVAANATLKKTDPLPECLVSTTGSWQAKGLVLWEGDWLLAEPSWDAFGKNLPSLLAAGTPWADLNTATHVPTVFAVSNFSRQTMTRCNATEQVDWLKLRDPSGTLREQLSAIKAYKDGCIDVGEEADVLAAVMRGQGYSTSMLTFAGPGSTHSILDSTDITALVNATLALAQ